MNINYDGLSDVMAVGSVGPTQHDVRSAMTIPTEQKPHSAALERRTMKRAVTINRAELKLAHAAATEATKNGLPFKRATAPGWHEMQFLFTEASAQGERGGPGEVPRDAPAVRPAVGITRSQV